MAQVNISERALAGIKLVASEMGWERRDAVGRFYDFWHDSQDLEKPTKIPLPDYHAYFPCFLSRSQKPWHKFDTNCCNASAKACGAIPCYCLFGPEAA